MVGRSGKIALGVLLLLLASWCWAQIPLDAVQRAKQATALVEVETPDGASEGSAFCIDASGLFITNAHVVDPLEVGGKLTMILRPGEKDQKIVPAHILSLDKTADLAILQADVPLKIVPLSLGSADALVETMSVVAFGYPFGSDLALKEGDYPGISVSLGHITALRKIKGDLKVIQLDAALNPGNSGGPVLNDKGEVIGIVQEGIPGSGINNAIPITTLRGLLAHTRILVTPPAEPREHLREAQEFRIQFLAPPNSTSPISVDLTLSADEKDHRTFHAVSQDGRTFLVHAQLLPTRVSPAPLELTLRSHNNQVVGHIPNLSIRVGSVQVPLSQVSRIEFNPSPTVTLSDDRVLQGVITGLSSVNVDLSGVQTNLNLSQFDTILISPPTLPASIAYHITARQDGAIFGEISGALSLSGQTAVAVQKVSASQNPGTRNLANYEILVCCQENHDIRRFDAQTGAYLGGFAAGNGLNLPQDMLWGPDGNLYIGCHAANTILRFNGKTGQFIDTFVSERSGGLLGPHDMAWGPDGNLYVSSHGTHEIKCYNSKNGAFLGDFVRAQSGGLDHPSGLRFGPDGNLYVSSQGNHLIKRYNGRTGAYIDDFAGGSGLHTPVSLEFGPDGNLYVCSWDTAEVKRFDGRTGAFLNNFVTSRSGGLDHPYGMMFGADGKLYIGGGSNVVKRYDAKTGAFVDNFLGGNNMNYPRAMLYRRKPSLP